MKEILTKRMVKEVVVQLKEKEVQVFVAEDGTEFEDKGKCEKHEAMLTLGKAKKAIEKLEIHDVRSAMPLNDDGYPSDCNCFHWYKVNDPSDVELLNKVYKDEIVEPCSYPEIICVETTKDFYENICDVYTYHLSDIKNNTINFWEKFGFNVIIEKQKED